MRGEVRVVARVFELAHVGFLENEMVLGIKLETHQDIRIERRYLDAVDQVEEGLVLGVLPDQVTGFLHLAEPGLSSGHHSEIGRMSA